MSIKDPNTIKEATRHGSKNDVVTDINNPVAEYPIDDLSKKNKSSPVPQEIDDLMSHIDQMLARGEEISDSLIQELEAQLNTSNEFDIEALTSKYLHAANFYGISALLHNKQRKQGMVYPDIDTDVPPVDVAYQNIPPASDEELMGSMREADDEISIDTSYDHTSVSNPNSNSDETDVQANSVDIEEAGPNVTPKPSIITGGMQNRPKLPIERSEEKNTSTSDKTKVPEVPISQVETGKSKGSQETPIIERVQQGQQGQQGQQITVRPLFSSLVSGFSAMMNLGRNKTIPVTHVSPEDFTTQILNNKIKDFEILCNKHEASLASISTIASKGLDINNKEETKSMEGKVSAFMKLTDVVGKEYAKITKTGSTDNFMNEKIKGIASSHTKNIQKIKEDLLKTLGDNAPSALSKLFVGVMDSIKKLTNKIFKIKPNSSQQTQVVSEPEQI
jgi:hypothetical protein